MIKKFENFDDNSEEFNEKKNWIKDAIKNPGALKKSLGKKDDEKISKKEIDSELSKLKAKDKDKKKPGTQLDKKDATKKRRLELAKTLSKLKAIKENNEEENYMFFSNLETIKRLVDKLLEMDRTEIDTMLKEHDWASDHITSSKDDVEEVFNFIAGHNDPEEDFGYTTHDGSFGDDSEIDEETPMQHLKSFFEKK
jgi:Asp-tRNA(Asn)/Glu-tRNA(Gln) amidotransferase C subunit